MSAKFPMTTVLGIESGSDIAKKNLSSETKADVTPRIYHSCDAPSGKQAQDPTIGFNALVFFSPGTSTTSRWCCIAGRVTAVAPRGAGEGRGGMPPPPRRPCWHAQSLLPCSGIGAEHASILLMVYATRDRDTVLLRSKTARCR